MEKNSQGHRKRWCLIPSPVPFTQKGSSGTMMVTYHGCTVVESKR
jgi:hypothetical protein